MEKSEERLKTGCTSKAKKCETGGKSVKLIVAISHRKGVICCEMYEKMDDPFFASITTSENAQKIFLLY